MAEMFPVVIAKLIAKCNSVPKKYLALVMVISAVDFVFMHILSALRLKRPWLNKKLLYYCDKRIFSGQQAPGCSKLLVLVKESCSYCLNHETNHNDGW